MRIAEPILNRLNVLKAVRRYGPLARTDLPGLTGLSGGLITQLTSDLLERGLIVERRDATRRPGRPRMNLEINAVGAIVIGVSLTSGNKALVSFADLAGNLRHSSVGRIAQPRTLGDVAAGLALAIRDAIAASPFSIEVIQRVGIALPGVVDAVGGIVHYMTTLPPAPTPFAGPISAALRLPTRIENEMTSMARAEHWFGRAQNHDTFTLVNIGHAYGLARYIDGLPLVGTNGIGPEVGHMKLAVTRRAPRCFCGARGCAGAYISIFGLLTAARMLERADIADFTVLDEQFDALLARAKLNDPHVLALFAIAGEMLGVSIGNHINAVDPGDILILAPNLAMLAFITPAFEASLAASTLPGMLALTRTRFDVADDGWRWKGTAALALEQAYLDGG